MKKKIVCIFVLILLLTSIAGALPSRNLSNNKENDEPQIGDRSYTHNMFGESFTTTSCIYCKYAHSALKYLYSNEFHPFYYITYVYATDANNNSRDRYYELGVDQSPTVCWDGDYLRDLAVTSNQSAIDKYNASLVSCGPRSVKDINLSLDVEWLGAVNNVPGDGATGVPIEQIMKWNNSEFKIDVEVVCNETGLYNGHLHVQVTEVESEWYDDKWGDPYTFEFKDWAYNDDVSFSGGGTWSNTIYWDGCDHNDKNTPPRYFYHITQDNIMVIAAIFDEDNDKYVDETTGFLAGNGTDPKLFDIYFGNTTPPTQQLFNYSYMEYNNDSLEFNTTYYWRVDVWNAKDEVINGPIWTFKTRANNAPYAPSQPNPWNGSINQPICINLSWAGGDPDGDNITYDVYFGNNILNLTKWSANQSETWWQPPSLLEFYKTYYWQIIAWDNYDYVTIGDVWHFTTEQNEPPDKASNPSPDDGENAVPVDVILKWNGSDPNICDILYYDVYFDDVDPPTLKAEDLEVTYYDPYGTQNLTLHKKYYWKIVTTDKEGETTYGDIWNFTVGINDPPTNPLINGPSQGVPDTEYEFTFVSTDPNGHDVYYQVQWDDGTEDITDLYPSGEVVTLSHKWDEIGTYVCKARAFDKFDLKSGWSEFPFKVPRNKDLILNHHLLEFLSERFPYLLNLFKYIFTITV